MEYFLLISVAFLPAICLLAFIYKKDKYRKEPFGQLLKGFGLGIVSTEIVSILDALLLGIGVFPEESETVLGHISTALFGAAIPEELIKFLFLLILVYRNKYFDEYFDGIVYAASIGLGFAALENVLYLIQNYDNWISTGLIRAIFSVPGHFMFAVTMGYFYSKARFGDPTNKRKNLALALIVPILLHAAFDAFLFISDIFGGVIALFYSLYIYMVEMSKRRGREHLHTDKKMLGVGKNTTTPSPNCDNRQV